MFVFVFPVLVTILGRFCFFLSVLFTWFCVLGLVMEVDILGCPNGKGVRRPKDDSLSWIFSTRTVFVCQKPHQLIEGAEAVLELA